jgi:glycosyltransferase involved in cell wall biosynthesis
MGKKLLLIGNVTIHTYNYYHLVKPYFDEIFLITDEPREGQEIDNIEFVSFSYKKLSNFYSTIQKMKSVCKSFKPDVIHIHQVNSVALFSILALKSFNIPIVLTAWGSDILLSPKRSVILKQIVKYCLKNAAVITADAEFLGQEVLNYMPSSKDKLVIANFGMEPHDELFTQKENIIYSNRLHKPLYNIDEIIRAFKKLEDTGRNTYRLVIAATGEETENLKQLAVKLNISEKVTFVGWLSLYENLKWYAKSKFYVSIPDSDATSISLLEAMYYGCYPIVSSLPAKREWISDRVNGAYYKSDFNFILDKDQDIIDNVAKINKRLILKKGTVEVAYQKFTSIYDSLINHSPNSYHSNHAKS